MPRKRRIAKRRRTIEFSDQHELQLLCGHDYFHDAYGQGARADVELMVQDWNERGAQLLEKWAQENPGRTPWALEKFGPPNPSASEIETA